MVRRHERLSPRARSLISDPRAEIYANAASAWEISTKFRLGRLPAVAELVHGYEAYPASQGFRELQVTTSHAMRAGSLEGSHGDPFDRLPVAQAEMEGMTVVPLDAAIEGLGVATVR